MAYVTGLARVAPQNVICIPTGHPAAAKTLSLTQALEISKDNGGQQPNHQRKEIKLSGGFLSIDNPVAHFGTGPNISIDSLIVTWPDGHISAYEESLKANRIYQIFRK